MSLQQLSSGSFRCSKSIISQLRKSGPIPLSVCRSPLSHFYQSDTKSALFSKTSAGDCKWGSCSPQGKKKCVLTAPLSSGKCIWIRLMMYGGGQIRHSGCGPTSHTLGWDSSICVFHLAPGFSCHRIGPVKLSTTSPWISSSALKWTSNQWRLSSAPAGLFYRSLSRIEVDAAPGQLLPVRGVLFCPIRLIVLQSFKNP